MSLAAEMRLYLANKELAEQEEASRIGEIPWYFTQGRKAKQVAKVKLARSNDRGKASTDRLLRRQNGACVCVYGHEAAEIPTRVFEPGSGSGPTERQALHQD